MDDEAPSHVKAECQSYGEARTLCKAMIDEWLRANYRRDMSAEVLYQLYTTFGEEPYIVPQGEGEAFRARSYAETASVKLCGEPDA
jgi:hypothetical protein